MGCHVATTFELPCAYDEPSADACIISCSSSSVMPRPACTNKSCSSSNEMFPDESYSDERSQSGAQLRGRSGSLGRIEGAHLGGALRRALGLSLDSIPAHWGALEIPSRSKGSGPHRWRQRLRAAARDAHESPSHCLAPHRREHRAQRCRGALVWVADGTSGRWGSQLCAAAAAASIVGAQSGRHRMMSAPARRA